MKIFTKVALTIAALALAPACDAATLVIDLDNVSAMGREGNPDNEVLTYDIGAYSRVTSLTYDVTLVTYDDGWLSEQGIYFGSSDAPYVSFVPGYDMDVTDTVVFTGIEDWRASDLDFFVLDDGILKIEFVDSFNPYPPVAGAWNGRLIVAYDQAPAVPEPATWALMILGFGAVGARLRSDRRAWRPARA